MWLCLSDSYLSIVEDPSDITKLLVRARRPGDIEAVFEGVTVTKTPGRDYLFRTFIHRDVVAKTIADRLLNIDYDNFKSSVRNRDLHHAYFGVWSTMAKLQPIPPYETRPRTRELYDD